MNKIDFMNFFRDDECLNSLSVKDRVEIFMSILPSGSDITVDRLNELLSDYSVDGCIVVGDKKPDAKYRLSEGMIHVIGSHGVKVNDKIEAEEMFEYAIIDRLDFVYQLIGWIAHAEGNDLALMTADLELLMGLQDDRIRDDISKEVSLR